MTKQSGRRTLGRTRTIVAVACVVIVAMALSACGSGTSAKTGSPATSPSGSPSTTPADKSLGQGVSAGTIKLGVALVNFKAIEQFTDLIRTDAEQKQIYGIYINDVNAHGGINGRKIVPYYRYYSPLGSAGILGLCTAFTQDDNVFAVVGTFVDFSGDAQTCIAKQEKRVLMTFNLTQAIIDKSPPGLIVTPGSLPEGSATILIKLAEKEGTLKGKTVAVLGDTTEADVVNGTIMPELQKAGIKTGTPAVLDVGTSGDYTTALAQLNSFMEKWKTEGVNAVFLSGDLASTKAFVQPLKKQFPNMLLVADNTDTLSQAQQLQQAGIKPNPYEGPITAGGLTSAEYVASPNWKYCSDIYQKATGKVAPNALHTIRTPQGKIDDTSGLINDACQVITMFADVAKRVGPYLNDNNWVNTVNTFGPIENRGSGPYSSLHTGKYAADDNWRLQEYDSSLGNTGQWKPVTPLQNIPTS
jgi:ABC-type branched-subunit amino acid transport system substrate-binding protein